MNLRVPVIDAEQRPSPVLPGSADGRAMKLCNEAITVFNAKLDAETDKDEYIGTVIDGASWYCEIVSAVDEGLRAANKFTIRIPAAADFGGKAYTNPMAYAEADDVSELFTLANGDIIVRGAVTAEGLRPKDIHDRYEAFTILGVTDNRRAPNAPHWKVVGS